MERTKRTKRCRRKPKVALSVGLAASLLLAPAPGQPVASAAVAAEAGGAGQGFHSAAEARFVDGVIVENTAFVPFRAIFEHLGAVVRWDEATKTLTAAKGDKTIEMTLDPGKTAVPDPARSFAMLPRRLGGQVMVPARFVAEAYGAEVSWDAAHRIVRVNELNIRLVPEAEAIGALLDEAKALYYRLGAEDASRTKVSYSAADAPVIATAFEARRMELRHYFTERFIDVELREAYSAFFYPTSLDLIPAGYLMKLKPVITREGDSALKVAGISAKNEVFEPYRFELTLQADNGRWLIDRIARDEQPGSFRIAQGDAEAFLRSVFGPASSVAPAGEATRSGAIWYAFTVTYPVTETEGVRMKTATVWFDPATGYYTEREEGL